MKNKRLTLICAFLLTLFSVNGQVKRYIKFNVDFNSGRDTLNAGVFDSLPCFVVKIDTLSKNDVLKLMNDKFYKKCWFLRADTIHTNSEFSVKSYSFTATQGEWMDRKIDSTCLTKSLVKCIKMINHCRLFIENIKVIDKNNGHIYDAPSFTKRIDNRSKAEIEKEMLKRETTKNYKKYYSQASESPRNDSLLWQLWEEKNIIEPCGLEYFMAKDKPRALNNIRKQLGKENYWFQFNNDYSFLDGDYWETVSANENALVSDMLHIMYLSDSMHTCSLVLSQLKQCETPLDTFLLKFIKASNNPNLTDSLVYKLNELGDPCLLLKAMNVFADKKHTILMRKLYSIMKSFIESGDYIDYDLEWMKTGLKKFRNYK